MADFLEHWRAVLCVVALVLAVLVWITGRLARRDERLRTLAECERRNRHQLHLDRAIGRREGVRSVVTWLRVEGLSDAAAAVPIDLLTEEVARG